MVYRPDIDGLRALAVVGVVLAHAGLGPFSGGFVGVDIFFVISGYLITSIISGELEQGSFTLAAFYERRARRILPALFVVLAVTAVAAHVVLLPEDISAFAASLRAAVLFYSNMYFWRSTDYFTGLAETMPLLHTWSLAVEEQFYLFWPLLLLALWRLGRTWVVVATAAITVASMTIASYGAFTYFNATFFLLPSRLWELSFGALLALRAVPDAAAATQRVRDAAAAAGLALMVAPMLLYSPRTFFPGLAAVAPCLGAALVIWAGQSGTTRVGRLLSARPIVFIGLISYSLYLWHWPILSLLRASVPLEPSIAWRIAAVALSVALAVVTWTFVETPIRDRRVRIPVRPLAKGLVAGGVALLLVGGFGSAQRKLMGALAAKPARDSFGIQSGTCFGLTLARIAERRPCLLGEASATPTALLWGDSHAEALAPGIDSLAKSQRLSVWYGSFGGCRPLIGVARWRARPHCSAFNDAMLDLAVKTASLTDVILVGRWNSYADGWPNRGAGLKSGPEMYVTDAESSGVSFEESRRVLARGFERTVAALRAAGKRIWLVEQVPYAGFDPRKVWRLVERVVPTAPELSVRLDVHRQESAAVERVFAEMASRHGARIVRPSELLCANQVCLAFDGSAPLYWDDHHLSVHGANVVAPAFAEIFRQGR